MTKLPTLHDPGSHGPVGPSEPPFVDEGEFRLRQVVAVLRRSKWLLLGCTLLGFTAAWTYTRYADRVYQAAVTLRIDQKQPNLPDIFQTLQGGSGLGTDVEVLGSRTLVEDAVRQLALQVRLVEPRGVARVTVLDSIELGPGAEAQEYRLISEGDSSFGVFTQDGERLSHTRPGATLSLPDLTLRLTPEAARFPELRIGVISFAGAVSDVKWSLEAARVGREADIITVRYEDSDPGLVWQVPNIIAERFIERRREVRKLEARSQVKFLREQIDTLSKQLNVAEEDLKLFRERARVVSPQVEASSQITRLVQLESERSSLEAERSALATLMAEAEKRQARRAPGAPSAYRDLLAFPSLLRSQAASQLLSSLTQVEDQRATLLVRRTEADADVKLLSARIVELEEHLAAIARTYLQGLTDQLASVDGTVARFNSELRKLPQKELEYARLDRKPTVLKEMYTLLQTRLKEAEIAEAVENSGISIVDPAIPPRWPVKPRPMLLMGAGLVGGLLVGLGLALVREYADRTVRTRAEVQAASGLPVMAVIPRIRRGNSHPAVIAERSQANGGRRIPTRHLTPPPPPPPPPTRPRVSYTFFSDDSEQPATELPAAREPVQAVARSPDVRMTISSMGGSIAEAYAILQTNIAFSGAKDSVRVLVLTSPLPGEGKTTTAVNLALILCERGLSVCLIDADMRRGRVHEVFGFQRGPGLSEVLQGRESFDVACRQARVGDLRNLAVLTSGGPVASPPGLVGSARMGELLDQLRERYDLIVIDTPPVNILTDAALVGVHADGVLLVVRAGATDIAAVTYAMEQLHHVRAPALGVVLNDVDIKRYSAYDGAYRYASAESYLTADSDQA